MRLTLNNSILLIEDRPEIVINNQSYPISLPESKILQLLIKNTNKAIDKNSLIVAAWDHPDFIGPNSLAVAISNIRKILKHDDILITNTPRVGYKLSYKEKEKEKEKEIYQDNINIEKIIIANDSNKFKYIFLSSPIQLIIFLLLTYFILTVIHSWVII